MEQADRYLGYLLSKKEGRVGSPEKPLSGLGAVTYKRYWQLSVFQYLRHARDSPSMDGEWNKRILTLTGRNLCGHVNDAH